MFNYYHILMRGLNVRSQSAESSEAYEAIFSQSGEMLKSQSNVTVFLSSIQGL